MLHTLACRLRLWWLRLETRYRLDGLDDHLLADLGTSREGIDAFVERSLETEERP